MRIPYSRYLPANLLVVSRESTCTCLYGLSNFLVCMHHSCVVSPPADQHGMLSSPMASSIAADISPVRHPLGMRSSLGLIAFVVLAELGVGIDAVEHDDVIGDDGVRLGQHTLDVGAGGTMTDDDEEPHLPSSLSANMVMLLSAKLK